LGINGKMNEVQSAMGKLQLKYIDQAIERRKQITKQYRKKINNIKGISLQDDLDGVKHNYAYLTLFINEEEYGMSRNDLDKKLKQNNIIGRRYFYPLISHFDEYKYLSSSNIGNLENAEKLSKEVICLPIYPDLENEKINRIIRIIIGVE